MTESSRARPATEPCDLCGEMTKYRPQQIELATAILADGIRNVCWCCINTLNAHVYYKWGLCWADPMVRYALLDWWLERFNRIVRGYSDYIPDLRRGEDRFRAVRGIG